MQTSDGQPPEFVGLGREAIVHGLVDLFDHLPSSGPRWVSLEAPTGIGKSRVVHEFYSTIAARQASPPYWPNRLAAAASSQRFFSTTEVQRKSTFPDAFVRAPGTAPEWFWWGFACAHRAGAEVQALVEDLQQLALHEDFIVDAATSGSKPGRRVSRLIQRNLRGGADAAAGDLAGLALGSVVPMLGLVMFASKRVGEYGMRAFRHSQRAASEEFIDVSGGTDVGLATEVAARIGTAATTGFRFVLFVEDFHWADAQLVRLFAEVLGMPRAAVLLVTTSWAGELDDPANPCHELLGAAEGSRLWRFAPSLPHPGPPFAATADLAPLSPADLAGVLRHHLPNVDAGTAQLLVTKFPNPNALAVLASLRRVRTSVNGAGLVQMDEADVEQMSPLLDDLYREAWSEVPEPVRILLSLAALSAPAELSPEWGFREERWDAEALAGGLRAVAELLDNDVVGLDELSRRFGWTAAVSDLLRRFNEPVMRRLARDHGLGDLSPVGHVEPTLQALTAIVSSAADVPWDVQMVRDRFLVAMAASSRTQVSAAVVQAAARCCAALLAAGGESAELLEFSGLAAGWARSCGEATRGELVELLALKFRCLNRAGHLDEAGAALEELRSLGDDDPALQVRLRLLKAMLLYSGGRDGDALLELSLDPLVGHGDEQRRLLALVLTRLYRLEEARALLEEPFEAERRGNTEVRLLREKQIASIDRRLGNLSAAHSSLLQVRDLQLRSVGPLHPDTLATQQLLGAVLRDRGSLHAAEGIFSALVELRTEVFGERHRDTMEARSHLVWLRRHQHRFTEALQLVDELTADLERVLGAEHPDTLNGHHTRGVILVGLGRLDEAEAELRSIWARRRGLVGRNGWGLLMTQKELARLYQATGRSRRGDRLLRDVRNRLELHCNHPFECELLDVELAASAIHAGNDRPIDSLVEAVGRVRSRLSDGHPEHLRSVRIAAASMMDASIVAPARQLAAAALEVAGEVDEDHPVVLQLRDLLDRNGP